MTDLCWQHYESDAYHDDHIQLRWPDVGYKVTVPDCGESNHNEVGSLEQVQMPVTRSLEVLNTTNTAQIHKGISVLQGYIDGITRFHDFVLNLVFK